MFVVHVVHVHRASVNETNLRPLFLWLRGGLCMGLILILLHCLIFLLFLNHHSKALRIEDTLKLVFLQKN